MTDTGMMIGETHAMVGETFYTASGEIAVCTRTQFDRATQDYQVYGVFCTGPLTDSMNAAGEPNHFCIEPAADEMERFKG